MAPDRKQPRRDNVPGDLEHSSGEVDAFEAELVRGAEGEVSTVPEQELEEQAAEAAPVEGAAVTPASAATPGAPTKKGRGRAISFLRASWAELQRVQWPDRIQVGQATAVVIGFVIVAGLYLGLADWVAQKIIDVIL